MATRRSVRQEPHHSDSNQKTSGQKTSKQKVECQNRGKVTSLSSITEKLLVDEEHISLADTFIQSQSQNEKTQIEHAKAVNIGPEYQSN